MATNEAYANRTSETLRDVVADIIFLLKQAGQTVAVAESLTAGSVMAAITSVGGASSVFRGGVVSYATDLKRRLLNVDGSLIDREGVIHGEVARQMAIGARKIATTDTAQPTSWGVSTTGVAGPDLQDGKAVGTVFIGIASQHQTWALGPFNFPGDREQIRQATVLEALSQLRELLRTQRADVQL
ncbi:uncharacterized protein B0I36DRAFT_246292 [Microdochium trichocladiopsis]|uniref:CinA C-terminal domain-containing protein n=1 Tax=Microdochium trichocladiopsis TaxID=1682393 RepID=A0A9P8Y382_9PEZI|nr:uncharacterized protein B0I36DRAFT_246292 [Microdochium trichocladiopsis]KAH7028039.1 hypothetical protein B0I36DRAFT_246292 [Microdochium trichocladiopsis]